MWNFFIRTLLPSGRRYPLPMESARGSEHVSGAGIAALEVRRGVRRAMAAPGHSRRVQDGRGQGFRRALGASTPLQGPLSVGIAVQARD